jgi:4-hydroxy 2-oxovalerate aldolase
MKNIQLLDCTLRDGGQGLEDLNKNGFKTEVFTKTDRERIANLMAESGADIVELGCMVESNADTTEFAIYQNVEELSKYKPERRHEGQLFVGLYTGPDTDLDKIPVHTPDLIDGIRVILRYSELEKSLNYCEVLARKGYKVFVQPMLTMRYTDEELEYLIDRSNRMGAYALYFVDSFGYMEEADVERLYDFFEKRLSPEIRIGFHAHNNMQMAVQNVKCFLKRGNANRKVIVDSCAIGMGQGAGNMQTELAVALLNEKYGKNYDLNKVLDVCEILAKFRAGEMSTWGYSPVRAVSAIHKAAYKYAVAMRVKKNMSLSQINQVLEKMPQELKHRYTPENLEKALSVLL